MKICIACGMPMKDASDHAMGDIEKEYCKYCMRSDGTMQSYEEKLESLANLMIKTQGFDKEVALNKAKVMLSHLPAWKD